MVETVDEVIVIVWATTGSKTERSQVAKDAGHHCSTWARRVAAAVVVAVASSVAAGVGF